MTKRTPSVEPYAAKLEEHPDCEVRLRFLCNTQADAKQLFDKLAHALVKGELNMKVVAAYPPYPDYFEE